MESQETTMGHQAFPVDGLVHELHIELSDINIQELETTEPCEAHRRICL